MNCLDSRARARATLHKPVDTMLCMCGTYLALRSGQEHRALQHQIELVERPGQCAF